MKVFYTDRAIYDLRRLRDFIAIHSPKAASETAKKLIQAVNRLSHFPTLGKEVKSTKKIDSLRDLITGKYIVRYIVLKHELHILRIWHSREQRV